MKLDFSRLFLIGYRGTGKSTVGRLLAERLGWIFVDADEELERRYGKTIRAIVAEEGEPGFRDKEEEVLEALCALERCVIATGGGVVLRESNRTRMRESGRRIWLKADAKTIAQRLAGDFRTTERRPNLGPGGIEEINAALKDRDSDYSFSYDFPVLTVARTPSEVASRILAYLGSEPGELALTELVIRTLEPSELAEEARNTLWAAQSTIKDTTWSTIIRTRQAWRALFVATLLEAEVNNGGFHQFFWNTDGELNQVVLEDLGFLEAADYRDIFARALAVYVQHDYELEKHPLDDQPDNFRAAYDEERYETLDNEYYAIEPDLDVTLGLFIKSHPNLYLPTEQQT